MKRTSLRIAGGIRHLIIENGIEDGNLSLKIGYNGEEINESMFFEFSMGEAEDIVNFLNGKIRDYQSLKK